MGHDQAGGRRQFDGEVSVAHRIQRIARSGSEAQQLRGVLTLDGVAGASQGCGAQWRVVETRATVPQAAMVALQHLEPRHHVVAEGDGLGGLQVGEPGHDGVGLALGDVQQGQLQALQRGTDGIDLVAHIQTDVGGHLVIARTPGVQFLARHADAARELRLDVHVHIFQRHGPLEAPCHDVLADSLQPGDDVLHFLRAQNADLAEHGGVGDGAIDVVVIQTLVEGHGSGEALDEGVGGLAESSAPGFDCVGCLVAHSPSLSGRLAGAGAAIITTSPRAVSRAGDWRRIAGKTILEFPPDHGS